MTTRRRADVWTLYGLSVLALVIGLTSFALGILIAGIVLAVALFTAGRRISRRA